MTYRPKEADEVQRNMSAIRSTGNATEVALRKALHARGYRYRLYSTELPGKPDFVFVAERIAVFVDGDYWHGRLLREKGEAAMKRRMKTPNRDYWIDKFRRNIARDDRVTLELMDLGWLVVRLWESEVKADLNASASIIESHILDRRAAPGIHRPRAR